MNNERQQYIYFWCVKNYSFCMQENGESLTSPEFIADGLEGTSWFLRLYPRGLRKEDNGYISLTIGRGKVDDGPEDILLNYNLAICATFGSAIFSDQAKCKLRKGYVIAINKLLPIDEVLQRRKADYLRDDTLIIKFRIWQGEDYKQPVTEICAHTVIGNNQIVFLHETESFSAVNPNQKKTIQIKSPAKKEHWLTISVYYSDDSLGKIIVEITSLDKNRILAACEIFLEYGSGKRMQCAKADNRFNATRKEIRKLPLAISRQVILDKSEYFPDDKLSLLCRCIFSNGVEKESIYTTLHKIPFDVSKVRLHGYPNDFGKTSALDDFAELYKNQLLSDIQIKTKTKSFPVHKNVLCARSHVFKAMLTHDMKEKNTNFIQVDDLENDTVQELLLFLYSDLLTSLQWESAMKLYYASDKYAIEKLKMKCSAFLVHKLCPSNASELLRLADTHGDLELKKVVEDYILEHEEQVFGSDEWEQLIETNPHLVIKTMHLKYRRNTVL